MSRKATMKKGELGSTSVDEKTGITIEWVSRTAVKNEAHRITALAETLGELPASQFSKIPLPDDIKALIKKASQMKPSGARNRDFAYIGKQMRKLDLDPVDAMLATFEQANRASVAKMHQMESMRDRLLGEQGDAALEQLLTDYPNADVQQIRTLIRNAKKELEARVDNPNPPPPKAYRALYQELKALVGQQMDELLDTDYEH
jgi:ribosome-associated protein